ncbi:hypothetical protein DL93DRAFT_1869332 [Clavulina sp. PMI_390]|nr:hypothetical protein DL93DRAFT_1869332 [Clavulina sp. PMI_390]
MASPPTNTFNFNTLRQQTFSPESHLEDEEHQPPAALPSSSSRASNTVSTSAKKRLRSIMSWLHKDEASGLVVQLDHPVQGAWQQNSSKAGLLNAGDRWKAADLIPSPPLTGQSTTLGMGAQIVRTPMEALQSVSITHQGASIALESPRPAPRARASTLSSRSSRGSGASLDAQVVQRPMVSHRISYPRLPEPNYHHSLLLNAKASPSKPRTSLSKAKLELPPLPDLRPISTFSVGMTTPPPTRPAPTRTLPPIPSQRSSARISQSGDSRSAKSSTSSVDVEPSPPLTPGLPPPPFQPILVVAPNAGPSPSDNELIVVETASDRFTTTLGTLTATPSQLATYVTGLFSESVVSATEENKNSAKHGSIPIQYPMSPMSAFMPAPVNGIGLGCLAFPMDEEDFIPRFRDDENEDEDYEDITPENDNTPKNEDNSVPPSPITLPSIPPTPPLNIQRRPSIPQRAHIFLDRPSAPYTHVLNFLRAPKSLPRSLTQMPANSSVRMDALLQVREEALFLGMDALVQLCDEEVEAKRGRRQAKLAREQKAASTLPVARQSMSSGHGTAVEDVTGSAGPTPSPGAMDKGFEGESAPSTAANTPRSSCDELPDSPEIEPPSASFTQAATSARPMILEMPPLNTVSALRGGAPVPVLPSPTTEMNANVQPGRASLLRASKSIAAFKDREEALKQLRESKSSAGLRLSTSTCASVSSHPSPIKVSNITYSAGHSRLPSLPVEAPPRNSVSSREADKSEYAPSLVRSSTESSTDSSLLPPTRPSFDSHRSSFEHSAEDEPLPRRWAQTQRGQEFVSWAQAQERHAAVLASNPKGKSKSVGIESVEDKRARELKERIRNGEEVVAPMMRVDPSVAKRLEEARKARAAAHTKSPSTSSAFSTSTGGLMKMLKRTTSEKTRAF